MAWLKNPVDSQSVSITSVKGISLSDKVMMSGEFWTLKISFTIDDAVKAREMIKVIIQNVLKYFKIKWAKMS